MNPEASPIKIQLRHPVPEKVTKDWAAEDVDSSGSMNDTGPKPVKPAGPMNFRHRARRCLQHPIMVIGLYLVATAMLGWSLVFRLGDISSQVTAEARMLTNRPFPELADKALNAETVNVLREEVLQARSYLVNGEPELLRLINDVERLGSKHAWSVELSAKPAISKPTPLLPIKLYPLDVRLVTASGSATDPDSAYHRLVEFMTDLRALNRKIDLRALRVEAGMDGIQTATLQYEAWTDTSHEEPSAK